MSSRAAMQIESEITRGSVGIAVVREKIRALRRLAPPRHHHRRDGGLGAAADRCQRCRLAVGCLQTLFKAGQTGKARRLAEASRRGEACRLAEVPQREA